MIRYYEELPEWASDTAYTHVEGRISFFDRLRVLVLGRFSMRVVVNTEHIIGRTESRSELTIPRLRFWPEKRSYGVVNEPPATPTAMEDNDGR